MAKIIWYACAGSQQSAKATTTAIDIWITWCLIAWARVVARLLMAMHGSLGTKIFLFLKRGNVFMGRQFRRRSLKPRLLERRRTLWPPRRKQTWWAWQVIHQMFHRSTDYPKWLVPSTEAWQQLLRVGRPQRGWRTWSLLIFLFLASCTEYRSPKCFQLGPLRWFQYIRWRRWV